jgi:glutathione S-transferase
MGELTLFTTKFSPFGQRVQVALTEKRIPVKVIRVDIANKSQAFLDANPIHKKVPAIVHNGKSVAESLVILEYLEDAFPEHPLMPTDAYGRSQVRFWSDYIYKAFTNIYSNIRMAPGTPEKQASNEEIVGTLKVIESAMTTFSAEGPFFTGDKFGYLDVVFGPFGNTEVLLQFCGVAIPGSDECPRLHKWLEVIKEHPSCSCIPPGEETLALLKARMQKVQ